MQSEANGNVYQILVHEMNWKRPLRFFDFFVLFGSVCVCVCVWGGGGGGVFIIRDRDLLGGSLVLCIFISVSSVFINTTCIQHQ